MEIAIAAGGALLSSAFEMLFDKLASPEFRQFTSKKKVRAQLEMWEKNLLPKICAVLEDAEEKQTTSRLVEIWLRDLRDLVYDVEDVLDEFSTEVLRLQLEDKQAAAITATSSSSSNKIRKFLPSLFTAGRSSGGGVKFNYADMGSKIKAITERLKSICTETMNLDLGGMAVARGSSDYSTGDQRQTTSLPDSHVLGRDQEKQAILDLLLAGEQSDVAGGGGDDVCVIPIQGMGGLGKTTLAQLVYNDEGVKNHFDFKGWVCVSDNFHILDITKTILQSVGGGTSCDGMNLDQLQVKLKNNLSGKKFFIVLDDVWNESYEDWTKLYKPLKGGAPGSRILVTTRSQEVSSTMSIIPPYRLGELPFGDCLSLFAQHALGATNFDEHLNLKGIGEKIVMKCKGLPLAAKTLGGLLRTKLLPNEWVNILESQIWDLPQQKNDIIPALRLSYRHLPSQLKQCFAYCATFPKDYEFDMNELVMLWMAEGFIPQPRGNKHLEEVGVAYFIELLSRSFFQQSSTESGRFVMHDLIHDLALFVAGETCFNLDAYLKRSGKPSTLQKARHSSFNSRCYELSRRFGVFKEEKALRTLLALRVYKDDFYYWISGCALNELLFDLIHLRALSLSGYGIDAVPDSINGLKHLRYLNLSNTAIKLLPEFVSSLVNLQTLLLGGCKELEMLPRGIGNLTKLCHLDISGTNRLKKMPVGIGNLIDLRYLAKFIVGVGGAHGLNIRELKGLSHLKGELAIEGLHIVNDFHHAGEADLKGKEGLESLVLEWGHNMDDEADENVAAKVLELLQPHSNLNKLAIHFYCGRELPSWIGDSLLMRNMVELELCNCWKSTSLPSLGRLSMLKHLIIKGMKAVKTLDFEFFGCDSAFSALETLKFEDMLGWEKWCSSDGGAAAAAREGKWKFPRLRELVILNCPLLVGECLISLPSLCKLEFGKCNESILRCMIDLGALTSLSIVEIPGLSCLHESLGIHLLVALEDLKIYNCKDLKSLWQSGACIEGSSTCLTRLEVRSCPQLSFLTTSAMEMGSVRIEQQQEGNAENGIFRKLRHVELEDCGDQFTNYVVSAIMMRLQGENSCVVDHLGIKSCDSLQHMGTKKGGNGVGGMLKKLKIEDCKNLKSLLCYYEQRMTEQGINNIVEIEDLEIMNCPSLKIDRMKLPVKRLKLMECNQFESLPEESIMLFHNINTPSSSSSTVVEAIEIYSCPNFKSLPDSLYSLTNLTSLNLISCNGLECFPESGLPIPNLKSLHIINCRNLKSLPKKMHGLTFLESLVVVDCPCVESITEEERGLPPNLIKLRIYNCSNMKQSMLKWSLHTLTSLRDLTIGGIPVPEDDDEPAASSVPLFPISLMYLNIIEFKKLESLSSWGIQYITSLKLLSLRDCPKVRYLPKEGLPPTLGALYIVNCPILANKCRKGKGKYWHIISLIPYFICRTDEF